MIPMNPPSVSSGSETDERVSRRHVLAAATGATAALAGCGSVLGRAGPRSLNPPDVIDDGPRQRVWEFPRGASDEETPVQAYLEQAYRVPNGARSPDVPFTFGATVFGDSHYHHNRITLHLQAPPDPGGSSLADIFVDPLAGEFTSFSTYQSDLETVISLENLRETGTIQFGFLVHSRSRPTPEALGYEFEVVAENDGVLGRNAVASDAGRFPIARED